LLNAASSIMTAAARAVGANRVSKIVIEVTFRRVFIGWV